MTESTRGRRDRRSPEHVPSTDVISLHERLEGRPPQAERANLRHAYLLQQFATRVFRGDYQKAAEAVERSYLSLGNRSPRELAETDAGMLIARNLVAEMEWSARHHGLAALHQVGKDNVMRELTLLLDLLPLAWGLCDEEFGRLLNVPSSWLRQWRDHAVDIDAVLQERLLRLRRFFDALRSVLGVSEQATAWCYIWTAESPIGQRSLLQAFEDDGDAALDLMELHLWGLAE